MFRLVASFQGKKNTYNTSIFYSDHSSLSISGCFTIVIIKYTDIQFNSRLVEEASS